MKQTIIIKECYHVCPFFIRTHYMECLHPFWTDKGTYDNLIITRNNSIGRTPDECPLRKETLVRTYKLEQESIDNK